MTDDTGSPETRASRTPWNKGKLTGPRPPLKVREIWEIRIRLQLAERLRDLALFNLAIDRKLRGCDLVALRVRDVAHGGTVAHRAIVLQHKTQQPVQFELTDQTRESVAAWIAYAKLRSEGLSRHPRAGAVGAADLPAKGEVRTPSYTAAGGRKPCP